MKPISFSSSSTTTSGRRNHIRLQQSDAVIWIVVLVVAGYPLLGTLISFTTLPSLFASVPIRGAVILLSLLMMRKMNISRWLLQTNVLIFTFWIVYIARLLWDLFVAQIPVASLYLFNFLFFCFIPAMALMHAPVYDERRLFRLLMPICMLICVLALIAGNTNLSGARAYTEDNEGRLFLETVNPITFGGIGVTTVLMALCWIRSCHRWIHWFFVLLAMLLGVLTIQLAASRGPLVSLSVCLVALALFDRSFRWLMLPLLVLFPILLIGDHNESSNLLLSRIDMSRQSDHSEVRMVIQASAIGQFLDNPLFGSAIIEPLSDNYPHNLFIEVAMATGVFGLVLITLILVKLLRKCFTRIRARQLPLSLLMLQSVVDIQFSGNIASSASLWILFTLMASTPIGIDKPFSLVNKVAQ